MLIDRSIEMIGKSGVWSKYIYLGLVVVLCLATPISPPIALAVGLLLAQILKNPFSEITDKVVQWLLKVAVVGLGFGMSAGSALTAGKNGFFFTLASITITLGLGLVIGKLMGIDKKITQLISSGTAICGGSAIAAISPIIRADTKQISISIGIIFLLNSVALFVFPVIGHYFELSQHQFGLWSAIAIHDTSAVVGAAQVYGNEALGIATTVKLTRALWILPVSLVFAMLTKGGAKKIKAPYFIGLFVMAIIANTYVPAIHSASPYIVSTSKIAMSLVLFLIGTSLNFKSLKNVGVRPLLLALGVWVFISLGSLIVILQISN